MIGPTIPSWQTYNPAYSQVVSEQIWSTAEAAVARKTMTPEHAVDEAIKRIQIIFERYKIA